jgi:hypothetical protein
MTSSSSTEQNENKTVDGLNTVNDNWNSTNSVLMHPGNVLLLTSIPFFAGAFMGYKIPIESIEDMMSSAGESSKSPTSSSSTAKGVSTSATRIVSPSTQIAATAASAEDALAAAEMSADEARALASRMAVRAFRIATFGTVATFGLVGAFGFYISGYGSVDEAVQGTRTYASSWRDSLERIFGSDRSPSRTHPDVLATKNMTEDEEMQYIYNNFMAEDEEKQITVNPESTNGKQ